MIAICRMGINGNDTKLKKQQKCYSNLSDLFCYVMNLVCFVRLKLNCEIFSVPFFGFISMDLYKGAKESETIIKENTFTFDSILYIIRNTNINDESSVEETFQKVDKFFQQNSLNYTELSEEFIETVSNMINVKNDISVIRFGIVIFSLILCRNNLETDYAFLERILPTLVPLLSISDDVVIIQILRIFNKLSTPSIECLRKVMEYITFQDLENIVKNSTNGEVVRSAINIYSTICSMLGDDNSSECLISAFSCLEYSIHVILPEPDCVEIEEIDVPILVDIINFLVSVGKNQVWDTLFKNSSFVSYSTNSFLTIKKTSVRIAALKLISRVMNNPLITLDDSVYEYVFTMMHHQNNSISMQALRCVLDMNPVDLSRKLTRTDLLEHFGIVLNTGSMKAKERLLTFLLKHPSIDWLRLYSDELLINFYDLLTNTDNTKIMRSILMMILKFISDFEKVDSDKAKEIKNMLLDAGAVDFLNELINEKCVDIKELTFLYNILEEDET